jgi:hypothetical protein
MIIDCFSYFNEKELLELRINLLYDKVDKFVITEGDHTHSGNPKGLSLLKTLHTLNLPDGWETKIVYVPVNVPNALIEPNAWIRERMQRDAAMAFIGNDDIAIVSDCDEIINPEFIEYYCGVAKRNPDNILRIPLAFLCSKANLRVYDNKNNPVEWKAPFIGLSHHFKKYTLSQIRESYALNKNDIEFKDIFAIDDGVIKDAGWHFTWMGDKNRAETKLKSFLHWDEVKLADNYIAKENSTDLLGRKDHILKDYPILHLPKLIFERKNIKEFLFQEYEKNLIGIIEEHPDITPNTDIVQLSTSKDTMIKIEKYNHIYDQPQFGEHWFTYPNLYKDMVKKYSDGDTFVEVGAWKGKSTAYICVELANANKKIDFFVVDTWNGSAEHKANPEITNLYDIFISNMKSLENFYHPMRMTSLEAAEKFADNSIDFIFIDASHEYQDVYNDLKAWYPKLKNGGIMAGHDYYPKQPTWGGVHKAVNELFPNFHQHIDGDCFMVVK